MRINNAPWFVMEVPQIGEKKSHAGHTDCAKQVILVRADLGAVLKAEMLMHELEHAFTCENNAVHNDKYNNATAGPEHPGIYWSANQWHRFMVENPKVIEWIIKAGVPDMTAREAD